jgi:hypothetical protein
MLFRRASGFKELNGSSAACNELNLINKLLLLLLTSLVNTRYASLDCYPTNTDTGDYLSGLQTFTNLHEVSLFIRLREALLPLTD